MRNIKDSLLGTWANCRGWRTSEKIVVIESDDWGAIRTPGRKGFDALVAAGIPVDKSKYDSLDCLETKDDMEKLLDVLGSHVDGRGSQSKMTFYTVLGNPDFDAIEENGFEGFYHENFFDSYERFNGENLSNLWQVATAEGLVRPQFHAREHLNSQLWLRDLRADFGQVRRAFGLRFFGLRGGTSANYQKTYLAAYWPESASDLSGMVGILDDGLEMFERFFGYPSTTFVPCNYIFPKEMESHLNAHPVKSIQCQRGQAVPDPSSSGKLSFRRRFTGQTNDFGQQYVVRNVCFEPYKDESQDWVGSALNQVSQAFFLRRPAVIVSHRVNYVSGLSVDHRDRCLRLLDTLLGEITARWPDVRFLGSDELATRVRGIV